MTYEDLRDWLDLAEGIRELRRINGVHVDPLSQKVPMADPIARNERQRFLQQSQPLIARMDQEKATMLAANKR